MNAVKTRLSVIQALLGQGIITHAQYMSLMYMKSVLASCNKPYHNHEGSVVAEAGSEHEHCDSDGGHDTDEVQRQRLAKFPIANTTIDPVKMKRWEGYLIEQLSV